MIIFIKANNENLKVHENNKIQHLNNGFRIIAKG